MVTIAGATPQETGSVAPAGADVTEQDILTTPTKPFAGVMLTVDVLPDVAPGAMVIPPLLLNAMAGTEVTVTWMVVDAVIFPVVASAPETNTVYVPSVVDALEFTVKSVVTGAIPVTSSVDGTEQVTGLAAFWGTAVTAHERFTGPAKPPEENAVIVVVFPVVAPALMTIGLAFNANATSVTVIRVVELDPA